MNEMELMQSINDCIEMLNILHDNIGDTTGNDKDTIIYDCRPDSVEFVLRKTIRILTCCFYGGEE